MNRTAPLVFAVVALLASSVALAQSPTRAEALAAQRGDLVELRAGSPLVQTVAAQPLDAEVLEHITLLLSGYEYFPTAADLQAVTPDPVPYLVELSSRDEGLPVHRHRAVAALAYFPGESVQQYLDYLLTSPHTPELMRHHVMNALVTGFGEASLPVIEPFLANADVQLRLTAVNAVATIATPAAATVLEHCLSLEQSELVRERIQAELTTLQTPTLR